MLLSYAWLKSYLPNLPAPGQLADLLMLHGLDVDGVTSSNPFEHVVVGEIFAIKPHPNADKLRIAEVIIDARSSSARQEIVCGAPNIAVGQKVPVALLGAKLPNGLVIESRAIRGVTSNGMLCAADELGIGDDHRGIMILDPDTKIGTPFAEIMGTNDEVIDVTLPANRVDLMSMRGLAWEIGAMLKQQPIFPPVKMTERKRKNTDDVSLAIADSKLCSLFTARVIRGIHHQPTPVEIVNGLRSAGMRSINIVADITNYIMLEYGQPLHAYDLANIHGKSLTARAAKVGEQVKTLDGKTRKLTEEMIVIADADRVVGLAGVMGGEETEVTDATTDIVLEAAMFHPVAIRKTSRQLGLVSEASKRFEKGVWPDLTIAALDAAAAMIADLCGGEVDGGIVKAGSATSPKRTVKLAPEYIAERLGTNVASKESKAVLERLGFAVEGTAKQWTVTVPAWRLDVSLPEDIVDEVGRMIGYDDVPPATLSGDSTPKDFPPMIRFIEEVKNILVDTGFTEVISHAFYGEKNSSVVKGDHFEIANPLDATQHKLRKSLLPQLEDTLHQQADAGNDARIFEVGQVFDPELKGPVDRQQRWKLALGITAKGEPILPETVNKLKQHLVTTVDPTTVRIMEKFVRGRNIEVCEFDVREVELAAKNNFGAWDPSRHIVKNVKLQERSKFPVITRDISFWWPGEESEIGSALAELNLNLLKEYHVTDTFAKDGKTSYALSFAYQAPDRTLTKTEVDEEEQKIKDVLVNLGATIR